MTTPIRVALVEDDAELCAQISELINGAPGFSCTLTASSGEAGLPMILQHLPDVVLMDIQLPGKDGIQTLQALKAISPNVNVLMLTVSKDSKRLFEALKAGANGYMLKRTSTPKLLEAIREVHEGGSPMSGQIARQVIQFFQTKPSKVDILTPREQQVLNLLALGHLYKEIAEALGISLNTIRSHIRIIYEKLRVNSRSQAIVKFLAH